MVKRLEMAWENCREGEFRNWNYRIEDREGLVYYCGSTIDPMTRSYAHANLPSPASGRASMIQRYIASVGHENFIMIFHDGDNEARSTACHNREIHYMRAVYKTSSRDFPFNPFAFNVSRSVSTAYNDLPDDVKEEACRKRSAALTGRKRPAHVVKKISESHKGKKVSEETRAKMSALAKGRKPSEESNRKRSKALTGKKRPPEFGAKMSRIKKGVSTGPRSQEAIRKTAEANRGRKRTPEQVRRITEGVRKSLVDWELSDEGRERMRRNSPNNDPTFFAGQHFYSRRECCRQLDIAPPTLDDWLAKGYTDFPEGHEERRRRGRVIKFADRDWKSYKDICEHFHCGIGVLKKWISQGLDRPPEGWTPMPERIPVTFNGNDYRSILAASKGEGIPYKTLEAWIKKRGLTETPADYKPANR